MSEAGDAIERGLAYLRSVQDDDGSWREWRLPPGESRAWPTAYVGWRLSGWRSPAASGEIDAALDRAAGWLLANELPDGGWGYAPATGPDADSTALASMFLRTRGQPAPRAERVLRAHRQDDGGYATYTRAWNHGAWTVSHPEITATAAIALADDGVARDRAARYLDRVRRTDGLWPSYWWTTPLYATDVVLAGGLCADGDRRALGRAVAAIPTPTAFERALQALCLGRLGGEVSVRGLAGDLVTGQLADGSWPSGPVLRLTHRHIDAPWTAPPGADVGPLFADERRLFATATSVAALLAIESHTVARAARHARDRGSAAGAARTSFEPRHLDTWAATRDLRTSRRARPRGRT